MSTTQNPTAPIRPHVAEIDRHIHQSDADAPHGPLSSEEQAELADLRNLKAWGSVRFLELDRRAHVAAVDAWRQADVFGEQVAPFGRAE